MVPKEVLALLQVTCERLKERELTFIEHLLCAKHSGDIVKCTCAYLGPTTLPGACEEL